MFFEGSPVRELGSLPPEVLDHLTAFVQTRMAGKWVTRGIEVMKDAKVLKALTPTNFDRLLPEDETALLDELTRRLGVHGLLEEAIYADVSMLPAGKKINLHVDWAMMHVLSRRIHVPLVTNPQVVMAIVNQSGEISTHHLSRGKIYEVNNQLPHAVYNGGPEDRLHVLIDLMDEDLYDSLVKTQKLTSLAFGSVINRCFSPDLLSRIDAALCCLTKNSRSS